MNNTTKRAYVLYIVIVAFFVGLGIMFYNFYVNGESWATKYANRHLYSNGMLTNAGTIYDSEGTALVYSKNGKRIYNKDIIIRKATLHAVGDNSAFIASGVQNVYKSTLTGYDFVNGIYNLKNYGKGNDIKLTLDADVCKTAYYAMDGRKGTVAVYNYKTGEIKCMVSTPTYDPENKPTDIDGNDRYEGVYLNRFLNGQYTPGSTFKVVTAISAIQNISNINSQQFECTGEYATGDGIVKCNGVHGKVNFEQALNHSCNSAFAQIAMQLGKNKLAATAKELGFNSEEKIDRLSITKSSFDVSKANKVDLGWAAIGQYTTLVNPYHLLTLMGAIANEGNAISPYFVKEVVSPSGQVTEIGEAQTNEIVNLDPEIAKQVKKMMRSNVVNYYGDSTFRGLKMCGKTGTAQVNGAESHSWFVGFSIRDDAPYAVVCVVENSGSGLRAAGPVVNKVMQKICK